MGNEMSKANSRRAKDWRYANRWFVGSGLDIGCGTDILVPSNANGFFQITSMAGYDHVLGNKDAQTLPDIADETYDFVVSSHCLEHLYNPKQGLDNWLRVIKSGGYVIVTVPDWELYEHKHWPSRFNVHQTSWTIQWASEYPKHVIHVPTWLTEHFGACDIEMMQLLTEHYRYDYANLNVIDQTGSPAECAIEFVIRKN